MADLKISQLSAATALAGTEVVPVVQGGATKKATIDQILAPASGKGIDFSAAGGDILTMYDEGTWTPTITFGGGSTGITYDIQSGTYTRIGRMVVCNFDVRLTNKGSSTGNWGIGGLPFTPASEGHGSLHYLTGGATLTQFAGIRITAGGTTFQYIVTGSTGAYTDADATNSSICIGQLIYFV